MRQNTVDFNLSLYLYCQLNSFSLQNNIDYYNLSLKLKQLFSYYFSMIRD